MALIHSKFYCDISKIRANGPQLKIANKCFIHCPAEDKAETIIF